MLRGKRAAGGEDEPLADSCSRPRDAFLKKLLEVLTVFDETNKTEEQELTLPDNLFEENENTISDKDFEDGFTEGDDVKTEASEPDNNSDSQTITIKYNGEEREISIDEARTLAQKGMNYDHVLQERDTRYKRELDVLDKIAEQNNMTRNEYVSLIEGSMRQSVPQGSPEEVAHQSRLRAREQIKRIHNEAAENRSWNKLFESYPELDRQSIRHELADGMRGGMSPLETYQSKLLKQRERELEIANNNFANATRAIGSLSSDAEGVASDAFLEGFSIDG